MGMARDRTNFLASDSPVPQLLTQEQVKLVSYGLQMWQVMHRMHPNPLKFLGKGSVGISRESRTAQVFWVPLIISGTGKSTDFKFCTHIRRVNHNKSP